MASLLFLALLASVLTASLLRGRTNDVVYGATFSSIYAAELGLDVRETYTAVLDELQVKALRIPVYWSKVEGSEGVYDFHDLDWMMNEAGGRGIPVTLVIGQKVPRWPECFIPDWAEQKLEPERGEALLAFMRVVVDRYEHHPALHRWQVENESFFPFGECPAPDPALIAKEIRLVKTFDDVGRPIQLTTSGEQAFWVFRAFPADVLGFSLYRVVQNDFFGTLVFPYPSEFYGVQRLLARLFADEIVVSELQAEPWGIYDERISDGSGVDAAYSLFTAEDLEEHAAFAKRTGAREIFFWGVEWWYYLRVRGEPRLWDAGARIINGGHESEE